MSKAKPNQAKHYMILKLHYSIQIGTKKENVIKVNDISAYFIEEINFALGHNQDHRSWSENNFNGNSGRLQITKEILLNNKLLDKEISYLKTKKFIDDIYNKNKNSK